MSGKLRNFDDWISELEEDVVQGEYGYERGEFTVYPEDWRPSWRRGLTPSQAFQSACDALTEARRQEDAARAENWARIQREDAAIRQALQAKDPNP
mgnify:CR=1 FL=1